MKQNKNTPAGPNVFLNNTQQQRTRPGGIWATESALSPATPSNFRKHTKKKTRERGKEKGTDSSAEGISYCCIISICLCHQRVFHQLHAGPEAADAVTFRNYQNNNINTWYYFANQLVAASAQHISNVSSPASNAYYCTPLAPHPQNTLPRLPLPLPLPYPPSPPPPPQPTPGLRGSHTPSPPAPETALNDAGTPLAPCRSSPPPPPPPPPPAPPPLPRPSRGLDMTACMTSGGAAVPAGAAGLVVAEATVAAAAAAAVTKPTLLRQ